MSSLLTNTAALTALTTLRDTNQALEKSSNRVSTGQKVATAADNAAYWSIATTIRADNGSLGAVKDAIGLGLATVNSAINGLENVKNTFLEIKNRLTAALSPNVDRVKLQSEIDSRQSDLRTYASSAATNGENWLTVDSGSGNYSKDRNIVASFSRTQGQISVGTVTVDVDTTKLYDATTTAGTTGTGATGGAAGSAGAGTAAFTVASAKATYAAAKVSLAAAQATWDAIPSENRNVAAQQAFANAKATFDAATTLYNNQVKAANAAATTGGTNSTGKDGKGGILNKEYAVFGADDGGFYQSFKLSVDKIDIGALQNTDVAKLRAYVNLADKVLNDITNVATKLGAVQSQIQSQSNYVENLMKNNDKSIGILVDADMEDESTRLKALQVQQQLGIQSVTIANTSTQQILSLFRS